MEDEYQRLAAGKSNPATLTLAFSEDERAYVVSIADDGQGIDFDAVRRTAVERGVLNPDRTYTRAQLVKTLFAPSFSTRESATEISGRGVGLDVVQEEIRSLGGKISLRTRPGEGTRFTMTIPKGTTRDRSACHEEQIELMKWTLGNGAGIALAVLAVFTACSEPEEPEVTPLSAQEISGERLWERITEESEYTTWGFWPGHEGYQPGQAPHGPIHRIFVNRPLRLAVPLPDQEVPHGGIIVKENLAADRTLNGYTVMAKVEGVAPATGDWFWVNYAADGTIRAEGSVGGCISCHSGMRDNDYIIAYPLDREVQ